MYLQKITAENFRVFGDAASGTALDWTLNKGLNILVGENDAGKSAVIDAIRQILWTTSFESYRLTESDFHVQGLNRADALTIEVILKGLTEEQEASALEWLTHEADGTCSLVLNLHARWLPPQGTRRGRVDVLTRSGRGGVGPEIGAVVREMVRATYLRPLRDVEAEMRPGRMSRLSQILAAHRGIEGQERSDFQLTDPPVVPETLVGLMAFAQHHIGEHKVIREVQKDINDNYLGNFALGGDELKARIRIAPDGGLTPILERFELGLVPPSGVEPSMRCSRGLGYNNALFMATELVLLRDGDELGLLLVEEPEAHLHPQLQERVMNLLSKYATEQADGGQRVQVVLSTHSPSLAAGANIEAMTLVERGRTYSLAVGETKLQSSDYDYLRRFIDATKSNLFFARGVAIVEGPAEALLLPAIAEACGASFTKHGVSVVNVGDVGLYHYARILQRQDEKVHLHMPVACITDRDIVPDAAHYVPRPKDKTRKRFESDFDEKEVAAHVAKRVKRAEGGSTRVFVSDRWTLEYDLARFGCARLLHVAVQMAVTAKSKGERLTEVEETAAMAAAEDSWKVLQERRLPSDVLASEIYQPLFEKDASKAVSAHYAAFLLQTGHYGSGQELLSKLPPYLQRALAHLTGLQAAAEQPA